MAAGEFGLGSRGPERLGPWTALDTVGDEPRIALELGGQRSLGRASWMQTPAPVVFLSAWTRVSASMDMAVKASPDGTASPWDGRESPMPVLGPTAWLPRAFSARATSGLSSRFHAPARSLLRPSVAVRRHQDGFHPAADAEFHRDAESDRRLVEKATALRFGNRSSKLIERLAAEEDEAAAQEGDAHGRSGRVGAPTLGLSDELEAIRGEIKRLALNEGEMNSEGPFGRGPVVAASLDRAILMASTEDERVSRERGRVLPRE
jgi:hypothetical protein